MGPLVHGLLTEQPDVVLGLLNSKLYKWIFSNWKWSGFSHYIIHLKYLPAFDLTRLWTDQEIYDEIGLTDEEIREVERAS